MREVHIIGGGTVFHVRPHLALSAPAYGETALKIDALWARDDERETQTTLHFTRMAGGKMNELIGRPVETNADVADLVDAIVVRPNAKVVFMNAALVDFTANLGKEVYAAGKHHTFHEPSGKNHPRLESWRHYWMHLKPDETKVISRIRKHRKDIFLVGFKTTSGASPEEQFEKGLTLLKKSSCNLVLANDVHTRLNMVITPEQARYHETTDRDEALYGLVKMTKLRSRGTFTRSTIEEGQPVPWESDIVPDSLRIVVDYCIDRGAYKPFLGATVGHFAVKIGPDEFLTSRRKTDFNNISEVGLVRVQSRGDHEVVAYGSRPSVGGQSQRIVFSEHPDADCIVHFHCPLKPGHEQVLPIRSQLPYECGSHECGKNTSDGLQLFSDGQGNRLYAVMLDKHGPNIVFNRDTDPLFVIKFIEEHFDLKGSTSEGTISKGPVAWHPSSP
jgi:hypothetical protein